MTLKLIYIDSKLKRIIENYLFSNNPESEHGGFLLGRDDLLLIPLILPNIAVNCSNSYLPCENWKSILDISMKIYQMDLFIHFHTHPNNTIISGQDLAVAKNKIYGNPEILLKYDKTEKKYHWKGYSSYEELEIVEIDKSFEDFKEYYSKTLGLINLGNIFIDSNYNILSDKKEGKMFLNFDFESYKLYEHLKKHNYSKYNKPTQANLMNNCELSLTKLKKAIEILKKNNLFNELF